MFKNGKRGNDMSTMQVEVVSAEAEIFSGQATMLIATAESGELGIYLSLIHI